MCDLAQLISRHNSQHLAGNWQDRPKASLGSPALLCSCHDDPHPSVPRAMSSGDLTLLDDVIAHFMDTEAFFRAMCVQQRAVFN